MLRAVLNRVIPPSSGQRFPALDGFRALAALSVAAMHTVIMFHEMDKTLWAFVFKFGIMAVSVFFALSAFLLYYPLAVGKKQNVFSYYKRRFFRIMPAYLVFLPFGLLIAWMRIQAVKGTDWDHGETLGFFQHFLPHLLFIQTWREKWGVFELGGVWSLPAEVHFYILLPILALLVARRFSAVIGLIIASFTLQCLVRGGDKSIPWQDLPLLFLPFFFGMLAALLVAKYKESLSRYRFIAFAGFVLLYLYPLTPLIGIPDTFPGEKGIQIGLLNPRGLWVSVACMLIIIGLATSDNRCTRFFASDWMRTLGICSYGIFLFNWPIIVFLMLVSHRNIYVMILGLPISIILGIVSYLLIEAPAIRLGTRRKYQQQTQEFKLETTSRIQESIQHSPLESET